MKFLCLVTYIEEYFRCRYTYLSFDFGFVDDFQGEWLLCFSEKKKKNLKYQRFETTIFTHEKENDFKGKHKDFGLPVPTFSNDSKIAISDDSANLVLAVNRVFFSFYSEHRVHIVFTI